MDLYYQNQRNIPNASRYMNPKNKSRSARELALEGMERKRSSNHCSKFKWVVEVLHGDGTHLLFQNAFASIEKFNDQEMLLVYTEHCGYYAFYLEDLVVWRKLKDENTPYGWTKRQLHKMLRDLDDFEAASKRANLVVGKRSSKQPKMHQT